MNPIFTVDGVGYNVFVPEGGLKRSGRILDGPNVGRVASGRMVRDIIGTYFNYNLQLDTGKLDLAAYDALYEALSAPVDYHTIMVPYGQSALTFQAYVSNLDDTLRRRYAGSNLWGELAVDFVAMEPQRRPR